MRIALGIQYDGAAFSGWQVQAQRATVQSTLERALSKFVGAPVQTTVAGRTDTGVHALGQVVHFDTTVMRRDFSWVRGVNAFLPDSISVQWAKAVPDAFNARFGAFERTYYYALYAHPVRAPVLTGRAGWVYMPVEVGAMRAAAAHLIGKHDFSAFRSSECQAKTAVKHLYAIDIEVRGQFIHFRFRGNAFLHHMVRNIMGCLIAVGRGRHAPDWLAEVRDSGDRRAAAPTFMPDGLYLASVAYPPEFEIPAPQLAAFPWSDVWNA
jgi:tRNA pseudouridine38-40 synthase